MPEIKETKSDLITKLNLEVEVASEFQEKKWDHWRDNIQFYRDFVETNRLTQRQAVNYPLMKETVKTILAKIDDPPQIKFKCLEEKELGADKEIVLDEIWDYYSDLLNYEGLDLLDKKNVLLCGRSFKKLNFLDRKFYTEVLDNYDILVDPKTNPLDIETARFVIHQHIFKPLKEIVNNDKYTKEGKAELKGYLDTGGGIIKSAEAKESLDKKREALKNLGVENWDEFGAADAIVELKEHYTYIWDKKQKKFIRHIIIYALDSIELFNKPLEEVLGVDFYPFVTWGSDVDVSDFWSDSEGDTARVPNKILNIWLSQLLENRTLLNYGMYWYDASNPNFSPQSFTPKPFGQYPVPGNPNDIMKQVAIPDLRGSIEEMEFIRGIVERATSTPPVQKGVMEKKQVTLGEIQLTMGKSEERIIGLAKSYRKAWKQFAEKWYKIMDANVALTDMVELYKKDNKGRMWGKEVKGKDWKSKAGYNVEVLSTSEQEGEKTSAIQKWAALQAQFPENMALQKLAKRRILENMDVTQEEIKEVMAEEEQRAAQALAQPVQPTPPPEMQKLKRSTGELRQLASQPL
jgi:hypothetical protein